MAVTLDPRKAHSAKVYGDVLAILTWMNDERALVLMPAHRAQGSPWFVIREPDAWLYEDSDALAQAGVRAARVMGMDESTSTWFRVAKIIDENLAEMIRMPHAPEAEFINAAIGEMHMRADGQVIKSDLIRVEREVPTYG